MTNYLQPKKYWDLACKCGKMIARIAAFGVYGAFYFLILYWLYFSLNQANEYVNLPGKVFFSKISFYTIFGGLAVIYAFLGWIMCKNLLKTQSLVQSLLYWLIPLSLGILYFLIMRIFSV